MTFNSLQVYSILLFSNIFKPFQAVDKKEGIKVTITIYRHKCKMCTGIARTCALSHTQCYCSSRPKHWVHVTVVQTWTFIESAKWACLIIFTFGQNVYFKQDQWRQPVDMTNNIEFISAKSEHDKL